MFGEEVSVCSPIERKPREHAQSDTIDTSFTQAVVGVQAEEKVRFITMQMVLTIFTTMIGLLINHHTIKPKAFQLSIFRRFKWLHFHL